MMQCGVCSDCVLVKFRPSASFGQWLNGQTSSPPDIHEIWPKPIIANSPEGIPENVHSFYRQAVDSLQRKNFDAAGAMFRKSLDTGLKHLHPEGTGTLQRRIETLPSEIGVTQSMKEWAHEIRDLGNDAAHEEEPFSQDEAQALHSFTELFLTYAFTLPEKIAERKRAAEQEQRR